jgi:mRNA interferase MazF
MKIETPTAPSDDLISHDPSPAAWVSPAPGDLCDMDVPFSDLSGVKTRPAVVLHVHEGDLVVTPVTGRAPKYNFEVYVSGWKQAGLKKPSTVQCARVITLSNKVAYRVVGRLLPPDWRRVLHMTNNRFNRIRASCYLYDVARALDGFESSAAPHP